VAAHVPQRTALGGLRRTRPDEKGTPRSSFFVGSATLRSRRLDVLADVDPLTAGNFGQLFRGDFYCAVHGAGCGQDFIECLQRAIQINRQIAGQTEWADTADRMAGQGDNFVGRQHFAFAQGILEFAVVDAGIASCHQQDRLSGANAERQGFGNAAGFDTVRFGSQRDGCRADFKFDDRDVQLTRGEELTNRFEAY